LKISGLQKLTLLDYPGHTACTVFLSGCNFRCPFCHNYELATGKSNANISEDELFEFLKTRSAVLDGVAITGGEPCINKELIPFIERVRSLGFMVKLDTNGAYPFVLEILLSRHLVDYVAMDIKNSEKKYAATCGLSFIDFAQIRKSIDFIIRSDIPYEFRTTVVDELHDTSDFTSIGELIHGAKSYYLQSFVDRESVPFSGFHSPSHEKLNECKEAVQSFVQNVYIRE